MNTTDTKQTELPKKLRANQIVEYFGIGLSTVWYYAKNGLSEPLKNSFQFKL